MLEKPLNRQPLDTLVALAYIINATEHCDGTAGAKIALAVPETTVVVAATLWS